MSAKIPSLESLQAELKKDKEHWNEVYLNGCSDPLWPDGTNLNLIHNHIAIDYRKIREFYPDEYAKMQVRIPSEVSEEYMARAEEIRHQMKIRYVDLFDNPAHKKMMERYQALSPSKQKQFLNDTIAYESVCRLTIEQDDLVHMRCLLHDSVKEYHEECRKYIQEMKDLKPVEEVEQIVMELW